MSNKQAELVEMNQCDGCRRGLPLDDERNIHLADGLPAMYCEASKYGAEPSLVPASEIRPSGERESSPAGEGK